MDGKVIEVLPSAMFKINLDNFNKTITATISGKMRKHNIRVLLGDIVEVEMSPYDLNKGRIIRRR